MICWSAFWKNDYKIKGASKTFSRAPYCTFIMQAQNSCSWRHNVKSKVRTKFITFSEIIEVEI